RWLGLGQARVGAVTDQHVVEPEHVVARGAYESAAGELFQRIVEFALDLRRCDAGERGTRELTPDDRCVLKQPTLAGREPVEPAGEEGLERRRQGPERPALS